MAYHKQVCWKFLQFTPGSSEPLLSAQDWLCPWAYLNCMDVQSSLKWCRDTFTPGHYTKGSRYYGPWVYEGISTFSVTQICQVFGGYPKICSVMSSNVFIGIFRPMQGHVCIWGEVPGWGVFFFRWRSVLKGLGGWGMFSWTRTCLLGTDDPLYVSLRLMANMYSCIHRILAPCHALLVWQLN